MNFFKQMRRDLHRLIQLGPSFIRLARIKAYTAKKEATVEEVVPAEKEGFWLRLRHSDFQEDLYLWAQEVPSSTKVNLSYYPKADRRLKVIYGNDLFLMPASYLRIT